MSADNYESKLYLHQNLSQTPLFVNTERFIHIPGQETLRRRIKERQLSSSDNTLSPNHTSSDDILLEDDGNGEKTVLQNNIISILTQIQSMDRELAQNSIRDCILAYRFFITNYQWMKSLQLVFPVQDDMPYIHRYVWVYWIQHYYWLDISISKVLTKQMLPIITRLTTIPPLPEEEELYNSPRSLLPDTTVYYSSFDVVTTGQQLTYYIDSIFRRMTPNEFTHGGWTKSGGSLHIKHAINHANIFCNIVVQDILSGSANDKFKYYFLLLQCFLQLKNYFTSYCLCMALQQSQVEKIHQVKSKLTKLELSEYSYICSLFDLVGNYDKYRKIIRRLKPEGFIPALPIHLKDITFLSLSSEQSGLKTWIKLGYMMKIILTPYTHNLIPRPSFQSIVDTQPILTYEQLDALYKSHHQI